LNSDQLGSKALSLYTYASNMDRLEKHYEIESGFFSQDGGAENFDVADPLPPRFGLVDANEDRWKAFVSKLHDLNAHAEKGISYKAIFAARHGEGYHNVAEAKYRTKLWEEYWARLNTDGVIVWGPDPLLTAVGEGQALQAHEMWKQEISAGLQLPKTYYCSPLTRCLQTYQITFDGFFDSSKLRPTVLENCRERYGIHTCDKRRSKTYIQEKFPFVTIEDGFVEEDELWTADERESDEHVIFRASAVLDHIFTHDAEHVISLTAHSGFINGLIAATHHATFALMTGGVLPMVVKCTVKS